MEKVYVNPDHSSQLLAQISTLWKRDKYCDAALNLGSTRYRLHKLVLVAACPDIMRLLLHTEENNVFDFYVPSGHDRSAVESVLKYLYEGVIELTQANVNEIDKFSQNIQLLSLMRYCMHYKTWLKNDYCSKPDNGEQVFRAPDNMQMSDDSPTQDCAYNINMISSGNLTVHHHIIQETVETRNPFCGAPATDITQDGINCQPISLLNTVPISVKSETDTSDFEIFNDTQTDLIMSVTAGEKDNFSNGAADLEQISSSNNGQLALNTDTARQDIAPYSSTLISTQGEFITYSSTEHPINQDEITPSSSVQHKTACDVSGFMEVLPVDSVLKQYSDKNRESVTLLTSNDSIENNVSEQMSQNSEQSTSSSDKTTVYFPERDCENIARCENEEQTGSSAFIRVSESISTPGKDKEKVSEANLLDSHHTDPFLEAPPSYQGSDLHDGIQVGSRTYTMTIYTENSTGSDNYIQNNTKKTSMSIHSVQCSLDDSEEDMDMEVESDFEEILADSAKFNRCFPQRSPQLVLPNIGTSLTVLKQCLKENKLSSDIEIDIASEESVGDSMILDKIKKSPYHPGSTTNVVCNEPYVDKVVAGKVTQAGIGSQALPNSQVNKLRVRQRQPESEKKKKEDSDEEISIFDDSDVDKDLKPDSEESDSNQEAVPGSDTSDVYPNPVLIQKTKQPSVETLKDDTLGLNSTDRQEADSTKEASILVPLAKSYIDGKRVVDKYHACIYCGKLQLRIARHIQTVHRNETVVLELQQSNRQEKAKGLDKLRFEGDYKHNIKVLAENSGFFILTRRPSAKNVRAKYSYSDFLPCEYCKGFFLKTDLWRHRQTCPFAPNQTEISSRKYTRAQSSSALMLKSSLPPKSFNTGFMECIISKLIVDEISHIVRNDHIILTVGENLFAKHGVKQKQYINQEIRLLGRIVKAMRTICAHENGYLVDFLKPQLFDKIVESAQVISRVAQENHSCSFETPSVALKCGPVLKKCCAVLKGQALRNSDDIGEKNAQRLKHLIEEEWKDKVTSNALRSIKEANRNEPVLLPSAHDLIRLEECIENEIKTASDYLKEHQSSREHFQALSSAVLCRIIMFNRRQSGEASKILAKDYNVRPNWKENLKEIVQCLLPLEKQLVNRLDVIEIRGKRGRIVPVILTPDIKESLDLLMKCRPLVQISEHNQYLFPQLSGTGHIQGNMCMCQFAQQAGLEHPERIGSTSVRKYIATVIQVLNLNEVELEWLSNHLGHSVNIHREFCRNQETAVELERVAHLLLAVDGSYTLSEGEDEDDEDADAKDDGEELDMDDNEDLQCEKNTNVQLQSIGQRKLCVVRNRVHWTKDENAAIERQFGKFFRLLKVPGKKDCQMALEIEPVLRNRGWATIKYRVYNTIQRLRKRTT